MRSASCIIFAVCFCALFLTLSLSAKARPEPAEPADPESLVKAIAEGSAAERRQAEAVLMRHRSESIVGLIGIVQDKNRQAKNREAVVCAIELLGELRAKEAVPVLARLIDFGRSGGEGAVDDCRDPDPARSFPAVGSLIKIGMPCLEEVTEVLKKRGGEGWVLTNCTCIFNGVLRSNLAKSYLEGEVAKENDPTKRAPLQEALRRISLMTK